MLQSLHVKNLALMEETEVEFGRGLNILTGETGAGKRRHRDYQPEDADGQKHLSAERRDGDGKAGKGTCRAFD